MTQADSEVLNEICVEVESLAFQGGLTLDLFNDRIRRARGLGADDVDLLPMFRTAAGEGLVRLSDHFRTVSPVGRNLTPSR